MDGERLQPELRHAADDRGGARRQAGNGAGPSRPASLCSPLASIGCALATSVPWLIAARTLQGAGAAVVMPLAMGLLGAAFPAERRGWAIGVFSGITGLAVLGGPMIGGAVTEGLAWQWIFWINVPVGLVAIPLVLRRIPESRGVVRRLDPRGATLITLAVLGLVWGVVRGAVAGWTSVEVVGSFVLGVPAAVGIPGLGEAGAAADGAAHPLPHPGVLRRQRSRLLPHRGAVQRGVLRLPVHAGRPRLGTAPGGSAAAAVDCHALRGRADRRAPGRPDRRASAWW